MISNRSNYSVNDTRRTVGLPIDINRHPVLNAKKNPDYDYYVRVNDKERDGGLRIPLTSFGLFDYYISMFNPGV